MMDKLRQFFQRSSTKCALIGGIGGLSTLVIALMMIHLIQPRLNIEILKSNIISLILLSVILSLLILLCLKDRCEMLIALFLMVSVSLAYLVYIYDFTIKDHCLLIAILGIVALIVPIILSISSNHNIGSKLDSGEIRKSIVVSLTIIYIIFLVMSFEQTLNDQPPATNGTYLLNVTCDENTTDTAHKKIIININSVSEGVLQVIPVTATANVANGTVQITPHVSNKTGAGEGSSGAIPLTSDNGTSLPTDAISSFTKNFLWVYALIISFYFGSRILENRADKSKFDDYMSEVMKNEKRLLDPLDLAKARFSLGEIGPREYDKLKKCLDEKPTVRIDEAYFENESIILNIWNGTYKDIKIINAMIKDKNDNDVNVDKINKKVNRQNKRSIIVKHASIKNYDDIKSIMIKTVPIGEKDTSGEYSDPITKEQIITDT